MELKKTSEEWHKEVIEKDHLEILDPDGWDRKNFEYSFRKELITKEEFDRRLCLSTVRPIQEIMTEREKELEELVVALLKDLNDRSGYSVEGLYDRDEIIQEWIKAWMNIISSKGYTKKHFPIEKLEAWLRELPNTHYFDSNREVILRDKILTKIKEFKEG